ncbi:MAG: penicillin-binding protein 2 [Deltaproteobacteria bacterium]|nr:penicillin-binding protein 2 [Deltaproteobacteria bacterium]
MYISPRNELSEFRRRYRWMRLFVFLTFLIFVSRLVYLQLVHGDEYHEKSMNNVIRTVSLPAVRGRIFDSKGRVMATSMPSHTLVAIPHYVDMGEGFARLVELLGLDEQEAEAIAAKLNDYRKDSKDMRRFQQIALLESMAPEQLAAVKAHQDELAGIDVVDEPRRYYPYGEVASHVIGYMNEVNGDDIVHANDNEDIADKYRAGDLIGRKGIERSFEAELRGIRGWRKKVVDARGLPLSREKVEGLLPDASMQEPSPGYDITLTIDVALQKLTRQALSGHPSSSAVIMNIHDGSILAAVSRPSIDSNKMTNGLTYAEHETINENPYRPRIDKTVYENYFPGSVFKPFTAFAALEEGIVTPEDVFNCSGFHEFGGRIFKCTHSHGDMTMYDALVQSCNVYFYNLAEMTGMDRIARYAGEFGFGQKTGVGYNTEATGHIPTREWYDKNFPGQFRIGHTLNASIGQGNTKVTLMQVAAAYSALANGGTLYQPQVVKSIETPDGEVVKEFQPIIKRRVTVSKHSMDLVMEALAGVVEDEEGTAHSAYNESVSIAGKTGTAQVVKQSRKKGDTMADFYYRNRDHAWFASVAPIENPEIAIVVLVEHGGAGGEHAAPVGVEIARRYFDEIAPRHEAPLLADSPDNNQTDVRVPVEDSAPTTASAHKR